MRVDSVHQGDRDKVKGVYHINGVHEVTQYQITGSEERISEHFLLPVLESVPGACEALQSGRALTGAPDCRQRKRFTRIPGCECRS